MTIIFVQPALPHYRISFFESLSSSYPEQFVLHHAINEAFPDEVVCGWARTTGKLEKIAPGLYWQKNVLDIPFCKGDILVISGAPRCLSNILLLIKAKIRGVRTVWWGHYWSSSTKGWRLSLRMLIMKLSDSVLFYTDNEVSEYKETHGRRDRRIISALNNGIDTGKINPLRKIYVSKDRPNSLLFIGRFTKKSKLELLVKALHDPKLSSVSLHLIGDGVLRDEIQGLVIKLDLTSRVYIHGQLTDETKIAEIANQCRLFVYPGEVGLSLIHGMAYGLPSVVHSCRRRHMPEIAAFRDGITGESFIYDDCDSLANAISSCLRDVQNLDSQSEESLRTVEESYNINDMVRRFNDLVIELSISK